MKPNTGPWAELEALIAEYDAASPAVRNYGSCRFADLFFYAAADLVAYRDGRPVMGRPPRPRHLVAVEEER